MTSALLAVLSLALAGPAPPQPADPKPKPAARPATAPTPPPVFEGTVRTAGGKPFENALVVVQAARLGPGELPASVRTDAEGRFRLPAKRAVLHNVRVEAAGWAPATLDKVRPGSPLVITLRKGAAIEGVVRDAATGSPVARAHVEAREERVRVTPMWEPGAGRTAATADAEGRFRIEGLAEGLHWVSARTRGYRGGRGAVAAGSKVELYLLPASTLSGAVRDTQGRPVAGAVVRVESERIRGGPSVPVIATDQEGRFEATGLTAGEHRLVARHPSHAPAWLGGIAVEHGEDASVEVVLHGGSAVTGRLLAGEEQPVAGRVTVQESEQRPVPWGLEDVLATDAGADGRFRLTLPPGAHALSVVAPGYAARRVEVDVGTGGSPVDVGDVTLESGLVIRGRVRDRTGAPVADAQVFGFSNRGMALPGSGLSRAQTRTEPDGSFVLGGPAPGTYRVSASAPGFAEAVRAVDSAVASGATGVDLVLDRAGVITGTVVDESGRAIDTFRVSARPVKEPGPMGGITMRGDSFAAADGRFVVEDVPDGTYVLAVSAPDRADGVVSGVVVAGGGTADVGRVRLGLGGVVRGLVVDGSGAPVGGASVNVLGAGDQFFGRGVDTVSDPGGAFELRGVATGTVELVATHPSYAEGRAAGVEVDPARGPAEARIVMAQGGRIEGRLSRRDGSGMPGAVHVSAMRPGARTLMSPLAAQAGPDGAFAIDHVPAGRMTVFIMSGTGGFLESRQSREVEVREGETTTVEFVSREILVTGHVTRGGAPAPGLRLRLMGTGGSRMMMVGGPLGSVSPGAGPQRLAGVTDESGSFALIVDEPGTYRVMATTVDGRTTFPMRTVEVPDVDAHVVELAFSGVPVTGVVVDKETEEPVAAASVTASPRNPAPTGGAFGGGNAHTGADGRFALELEPADYRVQAYAQGYAPEMAELTVSSGGPAAELRLAVSRGGRIAGRVVDPGGHAQGGVRVNAVSDKAVVSGGGGGSAETLPDGSFEVGGLPPGTYTLSAQSNVGSFVARSGIAAGQAGVTLTLQPGGSVHLVVRGPDGAPVERAFVRVSRLAGARVAMMAGTTTSPQGIAQLVAPAGDVELEVRRDKLRANVTVTVAAGATAAAEVTLAEAEGVPGP